MNLFRKLTAKPWTTAGLALEEIEDSGRTYPDQKVGLWVFLAVVTVLFALFTSAYFMRMKLGDWVAVEEPGLLWVNTLLLVCGSFALQWSVWSGRKDQDGAMRTGLLAGGLLTVAFLAGQYAAWQQLEAAGLFVDTNPANAFFYMITGVHGAHIAGGLVAWLKSAARVWGGEEDKARIQLGIELCATYWHYLLLVWVVMFGLLLNT